MPAALLFLVALMQSPSPAPGQPAARPAAKAAPASGTKAPAGPKTAPELTADLTAALRADMLAGDAITASVAGDSVTLTGAVHAAEHKGLATRVARTVAEKDGWSAAHVVNHLAVQPTHPS